MESTSLPKSASKGDGLSGPFAWMAVGVVVGIAGFVFMDDRFHPIGTAGALLPQAMVQPGLWVSWHGFPLREEF
jgi:hypothetical protein